MDRKQHWENIYTTKDSKQVSWYQHTPAVSIEFLNEFAVPKNARIIDIGGGDSQLVDHLLKLGFENITVLDISETAISKAKVRLGNLAGRVKWITADVTAFQPEEKYDFWHDRAAFHFLTDEQDVEKYIQVMQAAIGPSGIAVIGTFSENGPEKCSGIPIKQYSEISMSARLKSFFDKIKCITVDHLTPFHTIQNFIFCSFRKKPDDAFGS